MKKLFNILIIFFIFSSNVFAQEKTLFWMGEELTVDEYNKKKAEAEAKSKEITYTWRGKEVTKEEYERLKAQKKKEISDAVNKKLEKYGHSSNMDIEKNSFYKEYNNNSNSNTSNKNNSNFTGLLCRFDYKTDYFSLGYTNCAYRCDNYVNGVNTKMSNGLYAYYVNKKIWPGQRCPPGKDD